MSGRYQPGDWVVYAMPKASEHPGSRAREVTPTPHGDDYNYVVDKFWTVAEVRSDGKILARTRRGKEHVLDSHDPLLRHAKWWERLLHRKRFPSP